MHRPARAGLAIIGVAVALIVTLDLIYATEFTLVRRTISQHGLRPTGWIFGVAMVLLSAGSLAVVASVIRQRLSGACSAGVAALVVWSGGLLVVGLVPKHDWTVGPTLTGHIHRAGGIVAFLSLPLAALLISARWWRHPRWRLPARLASGLSVVSLLWMAAVGVVIVLATRQGLPWWRIMPFGAVQRGLALSQIATLVTLGTWAATRGPRRPPVSPSGRRASNVPSSPALD